MTKLTPSGRISKSIHLNNQKEYCAWMNIKARCYNPKCKDYRNYGGRGIKMTDMWLKSFRSFLENIGNAPGKDYTIERNDNNKGYEPGNCYWTTRLKQNNNKRNNILIEYKGQKKTLSQWCRYFNARYAAIYMRVQRSGIDYQKIFDELTPADPRKPVRIYPK